MVLAVVLVCLTRFLDAIERRAGAVLTDPVLSWFTPVDVTWLTFLVIYAGLIFAVIMLIRHPEHLLTALQTYGMVAIVRMAAMYLVPLDPPPEMIELKDPFVEFFGSGSTLTRDLFFSGHTSTLFMLALVIPDRRTKIAYLGCTLVVAVCVILQHVHYSIDVFAALFFSYGSYRVVRQFRILLMRQPDGGRNA
jgi:membrane-associated phospholipid phosphatase